MESNSLKLNKSLCILYIVIGSLLMLDAIVNCVLTFTLFFNVAIFMVNIILMTLCEIAVFVSSLVFGISTLEKIKKGSYEEATKAAVDFNLVMKFVYSLTFTINILGWVLFFGALFAIAFFYALIFALIFLFVFIIVLILSIALMIISIQGKSTQNIRSKATFTTACSTINFVITFFLLIVTGIFAIGFGMTAGYALALLVFISVDVISISLSNRMHTSLDNQFVRTEDKTATQN